ncbi:Oligopeptide transport ATP-binding protein OppD [Pseudovibrio sp. Ad46]|uniref:ABC transporter ATP-binding protein n=1 Tax=Pseudovibrio sp. Ad46 TaxID=989432 RepID=UPI0007AEB29B|nr:ABC transporter ATP-binding protein [Pseudovibrio sp. Ad46]KZK88428.1 Oligopeptide transport ATP-binding protein OppD [Pseudovibrio sp. Ad46]
MTNQNESLLQVRDLTTTFHSKGRALRAVDGISFDVRAGEVLGLVGESGSGKSISLRSIIGLARDYGTVEGNVYWKGEDLLTRTDKQLQCVRGSQISMIFQEPMTSLNPLLTVGLQIEENLKAHTDLDRRARKARAIELLDTVGIPSASSRLKDFPHQFSGGMRQRVMIAIALASNPELLLADEPTTALDVTIQDQILQLLLSLAKNLNMAIVLVTHDLGVVAQTCDRVAVMYAGRLVETGSVRDVLKRPQHPYTLGLLKSVPENIPPRTPLYSVPGTPPALDALPKGCAFAPRCHKAEDVCLGSKPPLSQLGDGISSACHFTADIREEVLA